MKEKMGQVLLPKDYEMNLSDFALFLAVMKEPKAYQSTLSIVLDEVDLELLQVKVEQVVLNKSGRNCPVLRLFLLHKRISLGKIWLCIPLQSNVRK